MRRLFRFLYTRYFRMDSELLNWERNTDLFSHYEG